MNIEQAAALLSTMYRSALDDDRVAQIHLFGIKYADELAALPIGEIVIRAGLPKSYVTEVNKGRLSRFVSIKESATL